MEHIHQRLPIALLLLRLGVFIVMFMWTLDKFVQPDHTAAVFANFYMLDGLEQGVFYIIGAVQLLVVLAFVAGFMRTISYGLVLVMHSVSTFSSYGQYLAPWDNLLFFAAWPMLAACIALWLLRDADTLLAIDAVRAKNASAPEAGAPQAKGNGQGG